VRQFSYHTLPNVGPEWPITVEGLSVARKAPDVSSINTLRLKWWPGSEATDKHMQIYFDESGDFNTARNSAYKFAFVVGIILPDRALQRLKADFGWFVGHLSSNEFRQGEPKGALLSLTHRQVLLEILKAHSDVMLIPLSVNLGFNEPSFFATAPARIHSLIENNLKTESSSMTIRERAALAKRFGRLSAPVMARLVSYGIAVLKAIESIACRYYCDQFRSDYDPITLIFDRTGRARNPKNFRSKTRFSGGLPTGRVPCHSGYQRV
jgi:hypothetical protein